MMDKSKKKIPTETTVRGLLRRNCRAILIACAMSAAIMFGAYFVGLNAAAESSQSTLATLGASLIWLAIACPVLSAGGKTWLDALLRGGIVADALGLCLLAMWAWGYFYKDGGWPDAPLLTLAAVGEIYCLYAAMSVAAIAAVRLSAGQAGRYAIAVASSAILMLAMASPFWVNGMLKASDAHWRGEIIAAAVSYNPFYSASAAVNERTLIVWHLSPKLYTMTRIGEYQSPGEIFWYEAVIRYGIIAAALTTLAALLATVRRLCFGKLPASLQ